MSLRVLPFSLAVLLLTHCGIIGRGNAANKDESFTRELLEFLHNATSMRFAETEELRHRGKSVLRVETEGEWVVGKALRVEETVWLGEATHQTTTIVSDGRSFVRAGTDEKWVAAQANLDETVPAVILDLPLYVRSTDGFRKGEPVLLRGVLCESFTFTPSLPAVLNINPGATSGRLLISRQEKWLMQVTIKAEGKDASGDPLSFSFAVDFYDHNTKIEISPPPAEEVQQ